MGMFDKITDSILGGKKGQDVPRTAEDQSEDEKKLVAFIRQRVDDSRLSSSRVTHEGIWMTNIAYILGFDNVYYDTTTRQYRMLGQTNKFMVRGRIHINKILPTIQNRLSRLCKNPPKYDIMPNSNDPEDKDAARLGLHVINYMWDKQKINQKRLQLMMWVQQAGFAYLKTSWDDCAGKPMVDPTSGQAVGYEGDVRVDVVSPFEVYQDPLAKSMDEVSWLVHAKVRKLDYFREHYKERGGLVKEEDGWLLSAVYEMRINALNKMGISTANTKNQMKNAAIELAYYEKPSSKHPNGRMVICAGGILLEDKELPIGEIPFAKFDDVLVAGKFFSESVVTHLRPIQDQYNKLITKRSEWTNRMLAGKYIAPRGHGLISEAMNDQSGEFIEYNPVPGAPPPMPMQIPPIPQYAYAEEDKLNQMFDQISGINEISRGVLPAAGIPAIGMQFLQEQDETRIGVVTENNEYAYAFVASHILKHIGKFYDMPRLLKISDKGMQNEVMEFEGKDLKDNYDVQCIRGSTIPNSKILRRQEILNALGQGLFGDPHDEKVRSKILDMLEFGDIAEAWEDQSLDNKQIKDHIKLIENGEIPPRNEWDNHPLHFLMKNRYRKSDKYAKLNPRSQQILMDDMEWHVQAAINIANPGIQMQMQQAKSQLETANDPNAGLDALSPEAAAEHLKDQTMNQQEQLNQGRQS